jgi:hypothetical protein
MIECPDDVPDLPVALADFDTKRSLADRRENDFGFDRFANALRPPQANNAGLRQDHSCPVRVFKLLHPGLQIPPEIDNLEVIADMFELAFPAEASGGDLRPLRLPEEQPLAVPGVRDEHITHILAFADRSDRQSCRQFGRQVFQTMYGEIDPSIQERMLNLSGEQSLVADLRKRGIEDLVTFGPDDFDADFGPRKMCGELLLHPAGLPEGKFTPPTPDA